MMEARTEESSDSMLYATFSVAGTLFGVDTMRVQEVVRVSDITPVHHAPDYLLGIMNLRGKIVTIVDLARKLSLGSAEHTDKARIFIVDWQGEYVGVMVDRVAEVLPASPKGLEPSPSNIQTEQGKYYLGVQHTDHGLVTILDIDVVLGGVEP